VELAAGNAVPKLSLTGERGTFAVPAKGPQALFFFKVSCPTCPIAAPAVELLRKAYPGLEVIAVSQDEPASTRAWLDKHGLAAPVALEGESYPASNAFGLVTVPTLVLVDGAGRIASVLEGWSRKGFDELASKAAQLVGVPPVAIAPVPGPVFQPG
jgi:peroxiredoxin